MAVTMNQRLCAPAGLSRKFQIPPPSSLFLHDKFFEEERRVSYGIDGMSLQKIWILIAQGENAAWFTTHNCETFLNVRVEFTHIKSRILARFFRQAFGNHRPSAALALRELDVITSRLQKQRGGFADLG